MGGFVWNDTHIEKLDLSNYVVYKNGSDGYLMDIEEVSCRPDDLPVTKDYITVKGWALYGNEHCRSIAMNVVLIDQDTNTVYKLPTTIQQRDDVKAIFGIKNSDWSGFSAKASFGHGIDPEQKNYKLALYMRANGRDAVLIDSGKSTEEYTTDEA